jgi:RNA polymerase sigma-70 factor (ECF subfamily)
MEKDSKRLKKIVEENQDEIFRLCFFLTHDKSQAEDLTQETFLRAFDKLHQLQDEQKLRPWLKSIARSLFLDEIKSARNSKKHQTIEDLNEKLEMSYMPKNELQLAALEVLSRMDPEERFLLVLIDIQEVSYDEAAEILKCPVGTVKSKIHRAREAFSLKYNQNFATNRRFQSSGS